MMSLESGRWPTAGNEMLVSVAGIASGIPTSGTLVLADESGDQRTVRIVGTVRSHDQASLVSLPDPAHIDSYLLGQSSAVAWPQVEKLNAYGLTVDSRYFREHPVPEPGVLTNSMGVVMVLIVTGVVIMTVLLAGPALTVSGSRHRRALAQLGSNGATSSMLRRYVFGQAILLGAISAGAGVFAGTVFGLLGTRVVLGLRPQTDMGPIDVPVRYAVSLAVVAALACLGAALIPATQAARTNVVAALRGQVSPRRVRRGWPIAGVVLAVVGGLVLFRSALQRSGGEVGVSGGAVLLFVGAMMCVPLLLAVVGRLAGGLPLAARIGVRDVSRQRGRSASAVGATMAVVALTTALAIGGTSDLTQERHDYQPNALLGDGTIGGSSKSLATALETIPTQVPGVSVAAVRSPAASPYLIAVPTGEPASSGPLTLLATLPPGCSLADAFESVSSGQRSVACAAPSNTTSNGIGIADVSTLTRVLDLPKSARAVLVNGGMLVASTGSMNDQVMVDAVRNDTVRLGIASGTLRNKSFQASSARTVTLPAAALRANLTQLQELRSSFDVSAVMTPQTAAHLGIRTTVVKIIVTQPGGVTPIAERAISSQLPDGSYLSVERGYSSTGIYVIWIMMAVMAAMLLIVTVVGTALVQGESAPDQATLGALGASGGLRRRIAAAQALALGLTGSVVGLLVGLVPGIAVTWPLTNTPQFAVSGNVLQISDVDVLPGPTIVIPWLPLAAVVIGVPLLAALAATVFQRRTPSLTARAT